MNTPAVNAAHRHSLRRLKWSAVVLPALFTLWVEAVRHQFFTDLPGWLGNLITASVAFGGFFLFAQVIFHLIARLHDDVLTRNRRLAALHALASVANQSRDEAATLAAALPLIRDALGAGDVRFVSASAATADPPDDAIIRAALAHDGETLGTLVVETAPDASEAIDGVLLRSMCDTLAVALANRRLTAAAARLAIFEERDRIARELHDGLAQTFAAITFQSARARVALAHAQAPAAEAAIDRIEEASGVAYEDVREAIVGLRVEPEADLSTALREIAERFEDTTGTPVTVRGTLPPRALESLAELQLTRVVQECLTNVRKHAHATAVVIEMAHDPVSGLSLTVHDDGAGFDPASVPRAGQQHFGLLIMRERVESLGGRLDVRSTSGAGTCVRVALPAADAALRGAA